MTAEEFYARFEFNPSHSGSLLGRGGFSSVYKVYDKARKRYVAIKRSEVGAFAKFDLDREVKLANEIEYHPNIIRYENVERIHDRSGTYDYAILKYYSEGNLDQVLASYSLNDMERRQILTGILKGLAHLHQIPIIHRDLKAANVLIDRDASGNWIPVIADFGLSRMVDADMSYVLNNSQIAITPNYASPEQYKENDALRPNTDLWAFGVMTYKMIIGKLPFRVEGVSPEKDSSNKIRTMVLEGKMPKDVSSIPEPYKTIIMKCLVVNPDKRVKRAEDLIKLLEGPAVKVAPSPQSTYEGQTQILDAPPKPVEPAQAPPLVKSEEPPVENIKQRPRKRRLTWEMALLAGSILFFAGVFYWLFQRPKPSAPVNQAIMAPLVVPAKADSVVKDPKPEQPVAVQKPVEVKEEKMKPVVKPQGGSLEIYTKYHDLKVYIDGIAQSRITRAGTNGSYKLPVGQGVIVKVEYIDFGIMSEAEPLDVKAGSTFRRSFHDKLD
jgi:serine/threonine protein kinase